MVEQRIIGIDFGLKNIGVAISVPETNISDPLKTVPRNDIWQELETIMKEYNITRIVIGFPLRTDGKEDTIMKEVKKFAREVYDKFKIPVKLWDESLSTHNAEEILKMNRHPARAGKGHKKGCRTYPRFSDTGCLHQGPIDHFSAALILEEYMECNPD